jgi:hypothetical protein
METATTTNSRLRKSLADEIDRLDAILDGLANALNESVATAVKEAVGLAVKEAVQAVLTEVLANPAVLQLLHGVTAQPATSSFGQRVRTVWSFAVTKISAVGNACKALCVSSGRTLTALVRRLAVVRHCKAQLLLALGVGFAAGSAAYFAGPWLAVAASGLGGFAVTAAVQGWLWLRRVLGTAAVWSA